MYESCNVCGQVPDVGAEVEVGVGETLLVGVVEAPGVADGCGVLVAVAEAVPQFVNRAEPQSASPLPAPSSSSPLTFETFNCTWIGFEPREMSRLSSSE